MNHSHMNSNSSISMFDKENTTIQLDENGKDYILPISDKIMATLDLKENDLLQFYDNGDESFTLRKRKMKFTFIASELNLDNSVVDGDFTSVEFKEDSLINVVNKFEMFMRGCGYAFDRLEIMNDEMGSKVPGSSYNSF